MLHLADVSNSNDSVSRRFVTLCTVQPAIIWGQPERTFTAIADLVGQAAADAAPDIVVLPEHFNAAYDERGEVREWERARAFASELARSYGINLVAGSVERWDPRRGGRFNTAMIFDRRGREIGRYDKRRLFGFEQQRGVLPGRRAFMGTLEGVRCAVLICSDLWHPELVRELCGQVDILCVPAQTVIRDEAEPAYARLLWHSLALTRAQENVLVVAVSDHAASSTAHYRCGGGSTLVDPSAEPHPSAIQQVLADGQPGYLVTVVDLVRLDQFRVYRQQNGLLPPTGSTGG